MLVADVSENNGPIDWPQAAQTPRLVGSYVKVSEGRDHDDMRASYNLHGAGEHGLATGCYHFARPELNPPEAEARHFLRRLAAMPATRMPPALDLETPGHVGAGDPVEWARRFNHVVHAGVGRWPIFYSYSAFIRQLGPRTPIGGGLWLADFAANDGSEHSATAPAPWLRYLLHQFTSRGRLNGHAGYVDLSTPSARFAAFIAPAV